MQMYGLQTTLVTMQTFVVSDPKVRLCCRLEQAATILLQASTKSTTVLVYSHGLPPVPTGSEELKERREALRRDSNLSVFDSTTYKRTV